MGQRKGDFAAPRPRFVKRDSRSGGSPRLSIELVACAAAVIGASLSGAFATNELPLVQRIAFWALLIGWNAIKWHLWFALTVRRQRDWPRATLLGAVVLNTALPFEITTAFAALGIERAVSFWPNYLTALLISATIAAIIFTITPRLHPVNDAGAEETPSDAPPPDAGTLFARASIVDRGALLAIEAQDHYVRLKLADGRAPLVYRRFADALADVRDLDGAQVRRGSWVAAHAVARAERAARGWRLVLTDGSAVNVSASFVGVAKARGWLAGG